ncbi:MAG: ferritin-like domain-containing protein [Alphaproteobacteria bacterium]
MAGYWTLDDVPWERFDASRVDPEMLCIVKAAALVEYNAGDYVAYLCNVFADDEGFQAAARAWGQEEIQHGLALSRWAKCADPDFDFDAALSRFRDGYRIPVDVEASVRGSRSGELVARCVVEVGTSSYYTALTAATDEPVLKDICRRIAQDEVRHFRLFRDHLERYLAVAPISRARRLSIAIGRMAESTDDELSFAYYAANAAMDEPYDRQRAAASYMVRALAHYDRANIRQMVRMTLRAVGLELPLWAGEGLARAAYRYVRYRAGRATREARAA